MASAVQFEVIMTFAVMALAFGRYFLSASVLQLGERRIPRSYDDLFNEDGVDADGDIVMLNCDHQGHQHDFENTMASVSRLFGLCLREIEKFTRYLIACYHRMSLAIQALLVLRTRMWLCLMLPNRRRRCNLKTIMM